MRQRREQEIGKARWEARTYLYTIILNLKKIKISSPQYTAVWAMSEDEDEEWCEGLIFYLSLIDSEEKLGYVIALVTFWLRKLQELG